MKMRIKIEGKDVLDKYAYRARRLKPAMRVIAELIFRSVDLNFRRGGRPQKWPELHPITLALRRKAGRGAKPLMDTGQLRLQMVQRVTDTVVEHEAMAPYAHVHQQYGRWGTFMTVTRKKASVLVLRGHGGGRGKSSRETEKVIIPQTVRIPARPFMLLQKRDITAMKRILKDYLTGGEKGLQKA